MIVVVDYNMGNVGSIVSMLKKLKKDSIVSSDKKTIQDAEKIILPGVGSFDKAFSNIKKLDLFEILNVKAKTDNIPILGICLGMQLLTNCSEEGNEKGFGWIDADTIRFKNDGKIKVPHMGWNDVSKSTDSKLTIELIENSRFYFVHSYYVKVKNESNSILKSTHSLEFDSAIQNENIYGVQFHPEKSHKFGMQLLKNFTNI
jgi:glutamine amidotransferase